MAEGTHELRTEVERAREDLARDVRDLKSAARSEAEALGRTATKFAVGLGSAFVLWKVVKFLVRRRSRD